MLCFVSFVLCFLCLVSGDVSDEDSILPRPGDIPHCSGRDLHKDANNKLETCLHRVLMCQIYINASRSCRRLSTNQ